MEIDKEIQEDKAEIKDIKKSPIKTTRREIHTISDIQSLLSDMSRTMKENGNQITNEEINQLVSDLRQIYAKEGILKEGLQTIRQHTKAYNLMHKKDIAELEKRLHHTKDKDQAHTIQEEIQYQQQMLKIIEFMDRYESRITEFGQSFNRLLQTAIQHLKSNNPQDAHIHILHAEQGLKQMKGIYKQQKDLETYLLKLDKKTIADLKKEKKNRRNHTA